MCTPDNEGFYLRMLNNLKISLISTSVVRSGVLGCGQSSCRSSCLVRSPVVHSSSPSRHHPSHPRLCVYSTAYCLAPQILSDWFHFSHTQLLLLALHRLSYLSINAYLSTIYIKLEFLFRSKSFKLAKLT